jgi:hypothetical protein
MSFQKFFIIFWNVSLLLADRCRNQATFLFLKMPNIFYKVFVIIINDTRRIPLLHTCQTNKSSVISKWCGIFITLISLTHISFSFKLISISFKRHIVIYANTEWYFLQIYTSMWSYHFKVYFWHDGTKIFFKIKVPFNIGLDE